MSLPNQQSNSNIILNASNNPETQEEVKSNGESSNHSSLSSLVHRFHESVLDHRSMDTDSGRSSPEPPNCPICYTPFNTSNHRPIKTPCLHSICTVTLQRLQKAECPTCRLPFPSNFRQEGVLPVDTLIMDALAQHSSSSSSSPPDVSMQPSSSSSSSPPREQKQQERKESNEQVPSPARASLSNLFASLSSVRAAPRINHVRKDRETVDKLIIDAGFASFKALTDYLNRYHRTKQNMLALEVQKLALQSIIDESTPEQLAELQALHQAAKAFRQVSPQRRRKLNNGNAMDVQEPEDYYQEQDAEQEQDADYARG